LAAEKAKYGPQHQRARRRIAAAIAGGGVRCELCGRINFPLEKWAVSSGTISPFHERCGIVDGRLGLRSSRDW
jgi:hypothetical protein